MWTCELRPVNNGTSLDNHSWHMNKILRWSYLIKAVGPSPSARSLGTPSRFGSGICRISADAATDLIREREERDWLVVGSSCKSRRLMELFPRHGGFELQLGWVQTLLWLLCRVAMHILWTYVHTYKHCMPWFTLGNITLNLTYVQTHCEGSSVFARASSSAQGEPLPPMRS